MVSDGRVDFVMEITLDENSFKIRRPDKSREIYVFEEDIPLGNHKVCAPGLDSNQIPQIGTVLDSDMSQGVCCRVLKGAAGSQSVVSACEQTLEG